MKLDGRWRLDHRGYPLTVLTGEYVDILRNCVLLRVRRTMYSSVGVVGQSVVQVLTALGRPRCSGSHAWASPVWVRRASCPC